MKKKRQLKVESNVKGRGRSFKVEAKNGVKVFTQEGVEETVPTVPDEPEMPLVNMTPYQINPTAAIARARDLYIAHYWGKTKISQALGIPLGTLNNFISYPTKSSPSWKQVRDDFDELVRRKIQEDHAEQIAENYSLSMQIVNRGLRQMYEEGYVPDSPRKMKEMAVVSKEFKHLLNTEEGKPNEITASFNLTQTEARILVEDLQKKDPLIDYDPTGSVND